MCRVRCSRSWSNSRCPSSRRNTDTHPRHSLRCVSIRSDRRARTNGHCILDRSRTRRRDTCRVRCSHRHTTSRGLSSASTWTTASLASGWTEGASAATTSGTARSPPSSPPRPIRPHTHSCPRCRPPSHCTRPMTRLRAGIVCRRMRGPSTPAGRCTGRPHTCRGRHCSRPDMRRGMLWPWMGMWRRRTGLRRMVAAAGHALVSRSVGRRTPPRICSPSPRTHRSRHSRHQ
mmetsp:Transcript_52533/g.132048  ORF Transcript_52533/g.132048 Transcript_52533/m.132048 type:complete len:231 (-) Transcript_52533:1376-2068(-)